VIGSEEVIDKAWLAFRQELERAIGVPLGQYKEPQMKRRLAALMMREKVATWTDFGKAIGRDAALLSTVQDTLTINVTEFFRQPERFIDLRDNILPKLMAERGALNPPKTTAPSVGCVRCVRVIPTKENSSRILSPVSLRSARRAMEASIPSA
jgi:chemotaxis protein methyltransferase CheR